MVGYLDYTRAFWKVDEKVVKLGEITVVLMAEKMVLLKEFWMVVDEGFD